MTTRQDVASPGIGLRSGQPDRRRGFRIDPDFQTRFRTTLLAFAVLVMTAVVLLALAVRYVLEQPGTLLASPVVPLALFGMGVAIVATSFRLADRISHRYCGPVRRIRDTLEAAARGERPPALELRKSDEFHGLAETVNATLRSLDALGERSGEPS